MIRPNVGLSTFATGYKNRKAEMTKLFCTLVCACAVSLPAQQPATFDPFEASIPELRRALQARQIETVRTEGKG